MLTVLFATLAVTRTAVAGWWVLAGTAMLLIAGTDMGVPLVVAVMALTGAGVMTIWRWLVVPRWPSAWPAQRWLERLGRGGVLLAALGGVVSIASEIVADKPGWVALVAVPGYLMLLGPLMLALRVGLLPKAAPLPSETGG